MTETATAHVSAMSRIAASTGISARSELPPVMPRQLRPQPTQEAAVRYEAIPTLKSEGKRKQEVRWVVCYKEVTPRNLLVKTGTINVAGLSSHEIIIKVAIAVLEYIAKTGEPHLSLFVYQKGLKKQMESVAHLLKSVSIRPVANEAARALNAKCVDYLQQRQSKVQRAISANEKIAGEETTTVSLARELYIDASLATGKSRVGYGYVINDITAEGRGGPETWNLSFGSGITRCHAYGGSTLAELRAINNVISLPGAISAGIRKGKRPLVIVTDSKWSVELLKWARFGTTPKIDESIQKRWRAAALAINEQLKTVPEVEFKWVKGHSNDVLNDAADRFALSARRNIEFNIDRESADQLREKIMRETLASLKESGINAALTPQED